MGKIFFRFPNFTGRSTSSGVGRSFMKSKTISSRKGFGKGNPFSPYEPSKNTDGIDLVLLNILENMTGMTRKELDALDYDTFNMLRIEAEEKMNSMHLSEEDKIIIYLTEIGKCDDFIRFYLYRRQIGISGYDSLTDGQKEEYFRILREALREMFWRSSKDFFGHIHMIPPPNGDWIRDFNRRWLRKDGKYMEDVVLEYLSSKPRIDEND